MIARLRFSLILFATVAIGSPAVAQLGQSAGYKFLQAVKDAKNDEVIKALEQPGVTVVNTRDITNGDGALQIVTRRGDVPYLNYLLGKDADPNLKNNRGETAMLIAAGLGRTDMVDILVKHGANVNQGDASGETPLIRAVKRQNPSLDLIRTLITAGADPDKREFQEGKSARDYSDENIRNPALAKLLNEMPKKPQRAVSGPKL